MTKLTLYAIIALGLTGCFRAADLGQLRRDIERELPEVQYEREIEVMPPIAKAIGLTLPSSTAATRLGTNWRSIRGPITTAPAAWHSRRRPYYWPARQGGHSTTYSCLAYHVGTRWRLQQQQALKRLSAPEASEAWGLKVVCSPTQKVALPQDPVKLILPIDESRAIGNSYRIVEPAQGQPTPCALPARRRFNRYPSIA